MKFLAPVVAILAVSLIAVECSAQAPGRRQKPGRPGGIGDRAAGDKKPADGARRRPGPDGAQRDPAQMVARLIQQFDKDNDRKLDAKELTAMLKFMRDRRGGMQRPGQAGGDRRRPGQPGRRPGGDAPARPGGDRPKRPGGDNT